jgi:glutathione S-transferase
MPTLYGVSPSPCVRKLRFARAEKGLDYDIEAVMPGHVPEPCKKLSPLSQVPGCLERESPELGWIVGDAFSLADLALGTARVHFRHAGESLDSSPRPRLAAYASRVRLRDSIATLLAEEAASFPLP